MDPNINDQELYRSLGRIEGAITALAASITNITTGVTAQDARINRIEGRINLYIGAAGALGAVGSLLLRELMSNVL